MNMKVLLTKDHYIVCVCVCVCLSLMQSHCFIFTQVAYAFGVKSKMIIAKTSVKVPTAYVFF